MLFGYFLYLLLLKNRITQLNSDCPLKFSFSPVINFFVTQINGRHTGSDFENPARY